jgi:hypothetical protein
MLALVVLTIAAPIGGGGWVTALAVRWLAGALLASAAVVRAGSAHALPAALAYEPAAVVTGVRTLLALRRAREIEWGGIRYARFGGREGGERGRAGAA